MLAPEIYELALKRTKAIKFESYRRQFGWDLPTSASEIQVDPFRFIYASAAIKGLRETLEMWSTLAKDLPYEARLFVTNPGYDMADLPKSWPEKVVQLGVLPSSRAVASVMATCAGLFYVNTFPETLCMTGVMAEALGLRLHVLCKHGFGGMREAVTSPLITDDEQTFRENFLSALTAPLDNTKPLGRPLNYSKKHVIDEWYRVVTSSLATSLLDEWAAPHVKQPVALPLASKQTTAVARGSIGTESTTSSVVREAVVPDSATELLAQEKIRRNAFRRALQEARVKTEWHSDAPVRAPAVSTKKRVALCMIVKNEAPNIEAALESARPYIDTWCIVDTGSTDATCEIVANFFVRFGMDGVLHERPWKDFGHNRTEALELAGEIADYALVLDADDSIQGNGEFPELKADAYRFHIIDGILEYGRSQLIRTGRGFVYEYPCHEILISPAGTTTEDMPGVTYVRRHAGSRSRDPGTFVKDAALLESFLVEKPGDPRATFYLAQSYKDAGQPIKAIETYRRRAAMTYGWEEERWYSLYQVANIFAEAPAASEAEIVNAYLDAYQMRPSRIEPLVALTRYVRNKRPAAAVPFARLAAGLQKPADTLFVDRDMYDWAATYEYSIVAYYGGLYVEALEATKKALECPRLPVEYRPQVVANMVFCREKLGMSREV